MLWVQISSRARCAGGTYHGIGCFAALLICSRLGIISFQNVITCVLMCLHARVCIRVCVCSRRVGAVHARLRVGVECVERKVKEGQLRECKM